MAFGKRNHVSLNPLSYNICLLGESKIGKTTVIKEFCEKLTNNVEGGYLFAEIGQERGADAIEGINYVNCPTWDMDYDEDTNSVGFGDLIEDIIENKTSDYKNLKVLVWDTYDQLINIAEQKSIELYNRVTPDKKVSSINAAWGGYARGEKKAIEIMLDAIANLRQVGVATIVIGHVKTKDNSDVMTGETFQTLTSDQQSNYFNALKKNMHIIGTAYIDRSIVKEKTGKKDSKTGKEILKGKIVSESRKIKLRDDTYCVDCGGRFADITNEINLDASEFIQAINDAILAEQSKSSQSLEEAKKVEVAKEKKLEKKVAENEKNTKESEELERNKSTIIVYCKANKNNSETLKPIIELCRKYGYANPSMIADLKTSKEVLELIKG